MSQIKSIDLMVAFIFDQRVEIGHFYTTSIKKNSFLFLFHIIPKVSKLFFFYFLPSDFFLRIPFFTNFLFYLLSDQAHTFENPFGQLITLCLFLTLFRHFCRSLAGYYGRQSFINFLRASNESKIKTDTV